MLVLYPLVVIRSQLLPGEGLTSFSLTMKNRLNFPTPFRRIVLLRVGFFLATVI